MQKNSKLYENEEQESLILMPNFESVLRNGKKNIVERSFLTRDVRFFFCLPGMQSFHDKGNRE